MSSTDIEQVIMILTEDPDFRVPTSDIMTYIIYFKILSYTKDIYETVILNKRNH